MRKQLILMTIALACATAQGAWAESVTFNVRSWNGSAVVTTPTTQDCTVLEGSHPDDWIGLGGYTDWNHHYYVVKGDVKYKTLNCFGRVHLILADGATLTCTGGIVVQERNNDAHLYIYSQSDGSSEGKLVVTNSYNNTAGIGSTQDRQCGEIFIHGGDIDVTGGKCGPGIGGGFYAGNSVQCAGKVYIYGGKINAQGGKYGAGIGIGASNYTHPKDLNAGVVQIYGGTVTATGGKYGAGIGGGKEVNGAEVRIFGGNVKAYGGVDAAGIGGGERGCGGSLYVHGGSVRAEGKSYGAGIGGGEKEEWLSITNPYIPMDANYSRGAYVEITGGTVIAIAGEDCKCRKDGGGSAIGCGQGVEDKDASDNAKKLELPDNYRVTAGDAETNIERVFTAGERIDACRWRNYVKIEACDHTTATVGSDCNEAVTYSIDDEFYHTQHCRYCNYTLQAEHEGTICVCGKTNFYRFTVYKPGTEKDTYTEQSSLAIGAGLEFYLPSCSTLPDGYTFLGWEMNPETAGSWAAILGEDIKAAGESVKTYLGQTPVSFYARFLYLFTESWTWADDGSTASVTLSHADLSDVTLASTGDDPQVTITSAVAKDENDNVVGTRYTATAIYTLNGYDYTFTDHKDVPTPEPAVEAMDITLTDTGDNSATLTSNDGKLANVTLSGRTLYKDGSWNTLCLPFDLVLEGSPLEGATLKTLASSDYDADNGTLTLNFADATAIEGGRPYLVKWTTTGADIIAPVFNSVTINGTMGGSSGSMYVDFTGTFSPVTLAANDKSMLYVGADNTLYYPSAALTIGSCRAYFALHNDVTAANLAAGTRSIVLNFGDGETTSLNEELRVKNEEFATAQWYTLDGRKLSSQPRQKGVYINKGIKVVMK